jgi:hypothetical protein
MPLYTQSGRIVASSALDIPRVQDVSGHHEALELLGTLSCLENQAIEWFICACSYGTTLGRCFEL